ncbi:MAG: peptidoglycan DD-metalloendopeptidase family protein [Rubrivivax sp.]|nr:peptidoglycan DD-metalloendopeptidase family protein [Rubrivivax sp.]
MKSAYIVLATAALLLAACTSPKHRAPVEERGTAARPPAAAPAASVPASAAEPLVAPSVVDSAAAARPAATYVVRPGDTLIRIGLDTGQNWRDLARWNGLDNPNTLEVGQVLRVAAPEAAPGAPVAQPLMPPSRVDVKPLPTGGSAAVGAASAPAAAPVATAGKDAKDPDDDLTWQWPASGPVLSGFDETRSKGVAIGGKAGDPVLAAADGRVVYAGSGLRGYGNLVIVKHNATFLSAYAHNQALLVKEDQVVRRGQKIAEMGSSDADRVQLHFEVRRLGRPVDPARYLPAR